jgi:hypothetical protein
MAAGFLHASCKGLKGGTHCRRESTIYTRCVYSHYREIPGTSGQLGDYIRQYSDRADGDLVRHRCRAHAVVDVIASEIG